MDVGQLGFQRVGLFLAVLGSLLQPLDLGRPLSELGLVQVGPRAFTQLANLFFEFTPAVIGGSLALRDFCQCREQIVVQAGFAEIASPFLLNQQTSIVKWLTLTPQVFDRASRSFRNLPPTVFLRSSDALHLACAAENGFAEIYSNDRHLLATASHFGLTGINVL